MLALVAMECPENLSAGSIRKKRAEVFNSIVPINTKNSAKQFAVRGQYEGYRDIKGVGKDSNTETYFKIKSFLKNSRWKNVPFYMESGKALKEKRIEIVIYFREASKLICPDSYKNNYYRNIFTIKIYPEEGIFIRFWIKKQGLLQELEYRDFIFSYNKGMEIKAGEYEKVLLDCFSGDQTLFTSTEEIKHTWRFITPVLNNWDENELYTYKKGSAGPGVSI
jgi:glucose-6-phosphate 1-dehydrogenase